MTLEELINRAVNASALCASYDDEIDRARFDENKAVLNEALLMITDRLARIDKFKGTEASAIKVILNGEAKAAQPEPDFKMHQEIVLDVTPDPLLSQVEETL